MAAVDAALLGTARTSTASRVAGKMTACGRFSLTWTGDSGSAAPAPGSDGGTSMAGRGARSGAASTPLGDACSPPRTTFS